MEDQNPDYDNCNADDVRWFYYDEQSAGWKNHLSGCLGVPYSLFLLWSKDNKRKQSVGGRSVVLLQISL